MLYPFEWRSISNSNLPNAPGSLACILSHWVTKPLIAPTGMVQLCHHPPPQGCGLKATIQLESFQILNAVYDLKPHRQHLFTTMAIPLL